MVPDLLYPAMCLASALFNFKFYKRNYSEINSLGIIVTRNVDSSLSNSSMLKYIYNDLNAIKERNDGIGKMA
jgi:spermidine synthase